MHRRTAWRVCAAGLAGLAAVPLLTGCSARLTQMVAIAGDGGGNLSVELRLDPEAQRAIDLPAQLAAGTFDQFLLVGGERWTAPGNASSTVQQSQEPDGTVVLTSVHRLRAGTGDLADLRSALGISRPLQPILTATGRYWGAPVAGETSTTSTTATTGTVTAPATPPVVAAGTGAAQAGITGLPGQTTLQSLLASEFTSARTDRSGRRLRATFTIASRAGVGEVLDPTCDAASNRYPKTRADKDLVKGFTLRYSWAMPSGLAAGAAGLGVTGADAPASPSGSSRLVASHTRSSRSVASEGASITPDNATATWTMPYGQCELMEISSTGADDGRFVNGLILGGTLVFLMIVFGLRSLGKRRRARDNDA